MRFFVIFRYVFKLKFMSFSLQKVTFQTFLISDEENTFVVYNYVDVNLPFKRGLNISIGYRYNDTIVQKPSANDKNVFKMTALPGNRG